ncbi:methionine adenosyltransferase domain-containing protein, partial [Succinivibrio sp.]
VSVSVNTFGTGKYDDNKIAQIVPEVFDLRPFGLIRQLDLLRPIYQKTASYGHFGRPSFSWEQTNKVDDLLQAIK